MTIFATDSSPPRELRRQTPLVEAVADLDALVAAVMGQATHAESHYHGPQHWQAVARTGLQLLRNGEEGHPAIVFLFALLHDAKRVHDGPDPDHGPRAARLAETLHGSLFRLSPIELELLKEACATHTHSGASSDPTLGVCFDSDRLNLWRVGRRPDPRLLSTKTARRPATIEASAEVCFAPESWERLHGWYLRLGR